MLPTRFRLLLTVLLIVGCDQCNQKAPKKPVETRPYSVASVTTASSQTHSSPVKTSLKATMAAMSNPESNEPSELGVGPSSKRLKTFPLHHSQLVLDELVDVAPAGPSAATPSGVLMLLRDGRTLVAPLTQQRSNSVRAQPTPLESLTVAPSDLVALEHGPAVVNEYAYFVRGNHLYRRHITNGQLDTLATDARAYTRVAVPDAVLPNRPLVVGYIARHPTEPDRLLAKIWVEGQETVTLTPDGSAGHSIALARAQDGYVALSLESRTGMSPLHARRIAFTNGKVTLSPDVVPWIAGTAQSLTELRAGGNLDDPFAFLPIERDASHFGLARIDIGAVPKLSAPIHWREYPNGLTPAVVTSGRLCATPVVIYARPTSAEAHAPQELHLATIGEAGLSASTVIASSRSFADASFAGLDDGALVVYVADHRTWARRLRCVPQ
jgi:hypothetical protein